MTDAVKRTIYFSAAENSKNCVRIFAGPDFHVGPDYLVTDVKASFIRWLSIVTRQRSLESSGAFSVPDVRVMVGQDLSRGAI